MQQLFEQVTLAIFTGETEAVAELLRVNPAVATHRAERGHPTLLQMVACEEPRVSEPEAITRLLLAAGASPGAPLVSAAGCNSPRTLRVILDHGTDVDAGHAWTPLDEALYWNNIDMAQLLLVRGASQGRLRRAAGTGDVAAVGSFFDGDELTTNAGPILGPFADTYDATSQRDPRAILDHAFVMAVNCGQAEAAERLLARGAEVNAVPPGYHWRGTALHAAIWRGNADLVTWLLEAGADPKIRDGHSDADAMGWALHHNEHLADLLP